MSIEGLKQELSYLADILTVLSVLFVSFLFLIKNLKKYKTEFIYRINLLISQLFKAVLIIGLLILLIYFLYFIFNKIPNFIYLVVMLFLSVIFIILFWLISTIIWTLSIKYVIDFVNYLLPDNIGKISYQIQKPLLSIVYAKYGARDKFYDVKDILSQMIEDNSLTVTASNKLMGDPLPSVVKFLKVEYKFGKNIKKVIVHEGRTITIPF